jgi:hypothetical protein
MTKTSSQPEKEGPAVAMGRLLTSLIASAGAHLSQFGEAYAHVAVMNENGDIDIHQIRDHGIDIEAVLGLCAAIIEKAGCVAYGIAVHMAWDRPGSKDHDIVAVRVANAGLETGGIYDINRKNRPATLKRRRHDRSHPAIRALRYNNRHVQH